MDPEDVLFSNCSDKQKASIYSSSLDPNLFPLANISTDSCDNDSASGGGKRNKPKKNKKTPIPVSTCV